jgi:hypothetical protein
MGVGTQRRMPRDSSPVVPAPPLYWQLPRRLYFAFPGPHPAHGIIHCMVQEQSLPGPRGVNSLGKTCEARAWKGYLDPEAPCLL